MHDHLAEVRLDAREEFDAMAELAVGDRHRDQQYGDQRQRGAGIAQRGMHRAHIGSAVGGALAVLNLRHPAQQCAKRRREEQRNRQRRRQRGDQRDRQIFHELADQAGPEQQRRECGDTRRGRGDHRARHAFGGERIGFPRRHPFRHPALGEFGHDDGIVDQHADREDQREQHHDVDGHAGDVQARARRRGTTPGWRCR